MSDTIIKLENISKQYRLGQVGTQTLRGDFQRWWHTLRGKEDPTLKIGQSNQLNQQSSIVNLAQRSHELANNRQSDYVWALKDINLEVKQGEVLGIIGKNGAGKSTLLKLLSRVTTPTTGNIKVKGRIASLLEVGTGFHPDLTGRENIFLNGAILGMTKSEIRGKFDEIVDFAGVTKYIDTPVKRYSSGMYVRLAFAVAAHLEPDILVVDEVLAVGDAEFQKKAIGKMQDISTSGGRTVLFVSHNLSIIKEICKSGILLRNGKIFINSSINEVIKEYVNVEEIKHNYRSWHNKTNEILEISLSDSDNINLKSFKYDNSLKVKVKIKSEVADFTLGFTVVNEFKQRIITSEYKNSKLMTTGVYEFMIDVPIKNLTPNRYYIQLALLYNNYDIIDMVDSLVSFELNKTGTKYNSLNYDYGYLNFELKWDFIDS